MYTRLNGSMSESSGKTLGYKITGKITEAEYQALRAELNRAIAEHGKIRLLVSIPELPAMEWGVFDEDLRFAAQHMNDIERFAVVGDSTLVEWMTKLSGAVVGTEVRHFEPTEMDDAWRWVRA